MNLYDILLARCICSNKSEESIVATPLEVTENGTYEAAEGYAYNPVTVNVSVPYSVVTVTLVSTNASAFFEFYGIVWDNDLSKNVLAAVYEVSPSKWSNELYIVGITNTEIDFLMFGESMPFGGNGGTLTVSGNAVIDTYDEEFGYAVTITGDCTLTMS